LAGGAEVMRVLSLFSGIGGLDLAAEWAGMTTVAFCERDKYCQKVLAKHWPGVPIFDDVTTLKGDQVGTVDLIAGGYPCQPFSYAGNRLGADDERYLWPAFCRLIDELEPSWVVGENVDGHVTSGLDEVCGDLERRNYAVRAFVFPASSVGAWQNRSRCFVVAHSDIFGRKAMQVEDGITDEASIAGEWEQVELRGTRGGFSRPIPITRVCGMADGLPESLDRLKALGNAVVPQQAYPIFKAIAEVSA